MGKNNLNKVIALLLSTLVIMGALSLTPVFATESEYDGIKVHAIHKDPESDWVPYLWAWDLISGTNAFSIWPGEPMKLGDDGWYHIIADLPENCEYGLSISNKGALQSADMLGYTAKEIWVEIDDYNAVLGGKYFSVYTEKPDIGFDVEYTKVSEPIEIPTTVHVKDELSPVSISAKMEDSYLIINAYVADGDKNVDYQFSINGTVYQAYSDKSECICSIPDNFYCEIKVSAKYTDGSVYTDTLELEVKNGEVILPETPVFPVTPENTEATESTTVPETTVIPDLPEQPETTDPNFSMNDVPDKGYHRYFFYMPKNWCNEYSTTAAIYWWEGTDACSDWPGYEANRTDIAGVYYYDVPDDVTTIIWNNNVDNCVSDSQVDGILKYNTVNIGSEYYYEGESANYPNGTSDFNGMIYVIDESQDMVNESLGEYVCRGEWYYYYGNGEYGLTPEKGNIYFTERTYNGAPIPVGEDVPEESESVPEKDDTPLADDAVIYFEIPEFWQNYKRIYCHICEKDGDSLANWQSKRELCVQESEGLYCYNISTVGGLQDDKIYGVIFSADTGYQTSEALLLKDYYGSTLYWNGKNYANPDDGSKTGAGVSWKNQGNTTLATIKMITVTGEIIGEVYAPNETNETLFTDFLTNKIETARGCTGKDDLDLINGIIEGLELDEKTAESIILSEGINVNWSADMLSGGKLVLGDSDLDGTVKIKDATAIQKHATNMISLSEKALLTADVNTDNKLNVRDATAIQKFLAKMDTGLEIGAHNVSVGNFSGTLPNIKTRLYFDIPGSWKDYGTVFAHIYDKDGNELSRWQSSKELCAKHEDKTYYFDTTRVGGLNSDVTYYVAFSTNMGYEAEHIKLTGGIPDSPVTLTTLKVPEIEQPVIPDDSDNNYDEPELEYTYKDYFDTLASWIKSTGSLTSGGAYKIILKNSGGDKISATYVNGAEERISFCSIDDGFRYETSTCFALYSNDSKIARYSFIHEVGYNCEGKISKSFSGDDAYLPCDNFFNVSTLSETKAKNDTIFYLDYGLKSISRQLKLNGAPVSLYDLGFVNY